MDYTSSIDLHNIGLDEDPEDHDDGFWTSYRLTVIVITGLCIFLILFVLLLGYLCLRLIKAAEENKRMNRYRYSSFVQQTDGASTSGYTNSGQEMELQERDVRMALYKQSLNKYDSDPELTYIWRTTPRYADAHGYGALAEPETTALPRHQKGRRQNAMTKWEPAEQPEDQDHPWTFPRGSLVMSGSSTRHAHSRDDYIVIVVDDNVTRV